MIIKNSILILVVAINYILAADGKSSKIVGGNEAEVGDYPWFSMLLVKRNFQFEQLTCAGSLIHPDIVLSAAHCVEGYRDWKGLNVTIGAFKKPFLMDDNGGQYMETRSVDKVIVHPLFNIDNFSFDVVLLRLSEPSTITPIKIDKRRISENYATNEKKLWTAGHGTVSESGTITDDLRHVSVPYVSFEDCTNPPYKYTRTEVKQNMICAGESGKDSCQGDSGGPLIDKEKNTLVGVTSSGFGCGRNGFPGIYSRISRVQKWIRQTICDNSRTKSMECFLCNPDLTTGKTHYVKSNMGCWKIELFEGGVLALEESDPDCLNKFETKTIRSQYKEYVSKKGLHDYVFSNIGTEDGFDGRIKVRKDPTLSTYNMKRLKWNRGKTLFKMVLILPDCNFGSCSRDEKSFRLDLTHDDYPSETSWDLVNVCSNETIGSAIANPFVASETFDFCLENTTQYKFTIYDEYGDGICCNYGEGNYEIKFDGNLLNSGEQFGSSSESTKFGEACKVSKR